MLRFASRAHSEKALQKGRTCDPLEPSQEGSLCSDSTVFTFSLWSQRVSKLKAKSSRNGGPMLSKTCPERVPKQTFETRLICSRLWGPKVLQNGARKRIFFRFLVCLAQSGPTGLSEWILRAKMEPKRSKWEAKVDPMAMPIAA